MHQIELFLSMGAAALNDVVHQRSALMVKREMEGLTSSSGKRDNQQV